MRPPPASPATPASTAPGAATAMVPALADAAFAAANNTKHRSTSKGKRG